MLLTDNQIIHLCEEKELIKPFLKEQEEIHTITHGPTPNGYDIRLGDKYTRLSGFKYIKHGSGKQPTMHDYEGGLIPKEGLTIHPRDCILIESLEEFNFPENVTAVIMNKSTWTKLFIFGPNTVIDGGYNGRLTLAMRNEGPWPVCIEKGMGIAHLIFHLSDGPVDKPYNGKYQGEKTLTTAKIGDKNAK